MKKRFRNAPRPMPPLPPPPAPEGPKRFIQGRVVLIYQVLSDDGKGAGLREASCRFEEIDLDRPIREVVDLAIQGKTEIPIQKKRGR